MHTFSHSGIFGDENFADCRVPIITKNNDSGHSTEFTGTICMDWCDITYRYQDSEMPIDKDKRFRQGKLS